MSATRSSCDKNIESTPLDSIWKQIRAHIEAERQKIHQEIKNYPRPIPACDLQFNHLLEKRAGICQDLDRMDEAARARAETDDTLTLLAELIRSFSCIGPEMKAKITSAVAPEAIALLEGKSAGR
jgi:hypothetical protein